MRISTLAAPMLERPRRSLALLLLLTCGGVALIATRLQINFSTDRLFVSGDPRALAYQAFLERFGADDTSCYLLVRLPQPLAREQLRTIAAWTADLERLPGVDAVYSPTQPLGGGAPLLDLERASEAELEQLRRLVRAPTFARLLLSPGGDHVGIVVQKRPRPRGQPPKGELVPALWSFVEARQAEGHPAFMTGIPVLEHEYIVHIKTDQARFLPLMLAQALLLLLLLFRSWRVIWALLAIGSSVVWAVAALAACGVPIDITNNILTVLVLVVGTSDAIHLLARFESERLRLGSVRPAIDATLDHVGMACLLTTGTTAAGFFSLIVIDNPSIQNLALFAPVGLMATFVVCITTIPLLLLLTCPDTDPGEPPQQAVGETRALDGLAAWIERGRWWLLLAAALALAAAAVGISAVEARSRWLAMLTESNRVSVSNGAFEREMAGMVPVELVISGPPGSWLEPEAMEQARQLALALESDAALPVQKALSAPQLLADLNGSSPLLVAAAGRSGQPLGARVEPGWLPELMASAPRIPPQPGLLRALLEGAERRGGERDRLLGRLIDRERGALRITLLCRDSDPRVMAATERRIRERFEASPLADRELVISGAGPLVAHAIDRLTWDMLRSLVFVYAMVFLALSVLFRSLAVGLISLLPNALPVLLAMGLMPALGLYLNFSIAVVFSIGVGIAVDDTIHVLTRYAEAQREGEPGPEAIRSTLRHAGLAVIYTSVLLICGFLTLFSSGFKTAQTFATLGLLISCFALVGDLLVLPALLHVTGLAIGRPPAEPPTSA